MPSPYDSLPANLKLAFLPCDDGLIRRMSEHFAPPAEACDHLWELCDESFDHEYGTHTVLFFRCKHCSAEREYSALRDYDDQ